MITSAFLFGLGATAVIVEETLRFARAHEARHEIVRHDRTRRQTLRDRACTFGL